MSVFLGIDVGLSGARTALLDRSGRLIATGRSTRASVGGGTEQDPALWLADVAAAVREAVEAAGDPKIEAIGVGALGPCGVTIDAELQPTGPSALFSLDNRAEGHRLKLLDRHGLTDRQLGPDHVAARLAWIAETDPRRIMRSTMALDATGFVVGQFTGRPVMDPITLGDHLAEGVPPLLPHPPVLPADTVAGTVTPAAARKFHLPEGAPVVVGSYDSYVDILGAGVSRQGEACLLLGTTLIIGVVVDRPDCEADLRATPHIGEGWFLGGWTSAAGSTIDWAARLYGRQAVEIADNLPPGANGVLMLPYLAGERAPIWDPLARGAIVGPTLTTSGADLYRAAVDSVALSALDLADRIEEAVGRVEVYRVNGGAVRNAALVQAMADACGATLEIVAHAGEAASAARLAARAVGVTIEPQVARVVRARPAVTVRYRKLLNLYRDLYPGLSKVMRELTTFADFQECS